MDIQGSVCLVTGGSRGIGRAIALAFARAGADVVVNHRRSGPPEKRAAALCHEIRAAGRRAAAIRADIADREAVHALFAEVESTMGGLDVLVLNAARAPFHPVHELLDRELRDLVETNFAGNVRCLKEALPLLERRSGAAIFVSSLGARRYLPAYPLGPMKAAMEAVVRDCGVALRPRGVTVNAVCGGLVRTDSLKTMRTVWPGIGDLPDDLVVDPEEIADVVLFLASPAARGLVGQTLVVDRGLGWGALLGAARG